MQFLISAGPDDSRRIQTPVVGRVYYVWVFCVFYGAYVSTGQTVRYLGDAGFSPSVPFSFLTEEL
jgi:hypothetical protein